MIGCLTMFLVCVMLLLVDAYGEINEEKASQAEGVLKTGEAYRKTIAILGNGYIGDL